MSGYAQCIAAGKGAAACQKELFEGPAMSAYDKISDSMKVLSDKGRGGRRRRRRSRRKSRKKRRKSRKKRRKSRRKRRRSRRRRRRR